MCDKSKVAREEDFLPLRLRSFPILGWHIIVRRKATFQPSPVATMRDQERHLVS
jgi:hypothetical protein